MKKDPHPRVCATCKATVAGSVFCSQKCLEECLADLVPREQSADDACYCPLGACTHGEKWRAKFWELVDAAGLRHEDGGPDHCDLAIQRARESTQRRRGAP